MASKRIRCPSCFHDHNWLRILPCKHQLCMGCINTKCPQCSQLIPPSPQSGRPGSDLPIKFAGTLTCDLCSKVKDAEDSWYCEQCVVVLCSTCCLRNHSKDFPEHQIYEWCSSLRPLQHCTSALHQYNALEDPLSNQAKLKEIMEPVQQRLISLMQEGHSVEDVAKRVEKAFSIQGSARNEGSPGAEEKLENHLKVAKQALVLTNLMKHKDPVLPKLGGFKQDPDAIARIMFNQLDFGPTPVSAVANPVQEVQQQRAKPFQPIQSKKIFSVGSEARASAAQGSTPLLSKAFHIPTKGAEVSSVVFGSNRFLALLTDSSIQVWSIKDDPVPIGSLMREVRNQAFVAAAISERGDLLFVISKTNDQWDVLIFEMSNCRWLETMRVEQGINIRSARVGATDWGVAYLVLNSVGQTGSVFGQFYRLSRIPPHENKDFRLMQLQMNSMAYKRVAAKCVAKFRHLVAAMEAEQPNVFTFLWDGFNKSLQNAQRIQLLTPSPLLNVSFRADEDVLFVFSLNHLQWWKFYDGEWKKGFDGDIKAGFACDLGILNGRIVAAVDQQTDRRRFRFVFFQRVGPQWGPCDE